MRVNEENFATGDAEDIEPSYVEAVIENHNQDEGAHPDIRKQIAETQAFYQSAKDSVQGVAESVGVMANKADYAAQVARTVCPRIIDGEWHVFDEEEFGGFVASGIMAEGSDGHTPERGVDYWTDGDKAEIVADVLAALPSAEEVAY